jgi:hypothetical protein
MDAQLLVEVIALAISLIMILAIARLFSIDKKLGDLISVQKAIAEGSGISSAWQCENCKAVTDSLLAPTGICPKCQYFQWKKITAKGATS